MCLYLYFIQICICNVKFIFHYLCQSMEKVSYRMLIFSDIIENKSTENKMKSGELPSALFLLLISAFIYKIDLQVFFIWFFVLRVTNNFANNCQLYRINSSLKAYCIYHCFISNSSENTHLNSNILPFLC